MSGPYDLEPPSAAHRHLPVMLDEVMAAFEPVMPGLVVDCTVGAGGHAGAVLERWPGSRVIGIDRDPEALTIASANLAGYGGRVRLVHGNFRELAVLLAAEAGPTGCPQADALLMDLGVSSMHFDQATRGFAYTAPEAPLDMRMDPADEVTAAGLLNRLGQQELSRIIRDYGEERWASRIARFVVEARDRQPITTAGQLTEIIKAAIPAAARRKGGHPARRTFQALRIAVNDELGALRDGLSAAARVLRPGGRMAVISFHSLEDRLVKVAFRELALAGEYQLVTRKPLEPQEAEVLVNPRSRSAKLRVLSRVLEPTGGE